MSEKSPLFLLFSKRIKEEGRESKEKSLTVTVNMSFSHFHKKVCASQVLVPVWISPGCAMGFAPFMDRSLLVVHPLFIQEPKLGCHRTLCGSVSNTTLVWSVVEQNEHASWAKAGVFILRWLRQGLAVMNEGRCSRYRWLWKGSGQWVREGVVDREVIESGCD